MKNIKRIAKEIIAGPRVPEVVSTQQGSVVLRRDDFKNNDMWNTLISSVGLDDKFYKDVETIDQGDERSADLDDYGEVEITISRSKLRS